jgi:hypothetical protein
MPRENKLHVLCTPGKAGWRVEYKSCAGTGATKEAAQQDFKLKLAVYLCAIMCIRQGMGLDLSMLLTLYGCDGIVYEVRT